VNITYYIFVKEFFDKDPGMGYDNRVYFSAKGCGGRYGREIIQMGLTAAIG
jgi:hypothetical protein